MERLIFKILVLSAVFLPCGARAWQIMTPYPTTENLAIIEKIYQSVEAEFSEQEEKESREQDEKKREQKDAKKDGSAVKDNKGNADISEYPPYADKELTQELSKKSPSIPVVEDIIKRTFVYSSKSLDSKEEADLRTKDDNSEETSGTLERLQIQTILVYENARALARRTLDLMEKADKDVEEIRSEGKNRNSTGSVQKGIASSVMFRTHRLLNEIAVIRNSYIEINAINVIQGTELPQKGGGLVEGVLGSLTGG